MRRADPFRSAVNHSHSTTVNCGHDDCLDRNGHESMGSGLMKSVVADRIRARFVSFWSWCEYKHSLDREFAEKSLWDDRLLKTRRFWRRLPVKKKSLSFARRVRYPGRRSHDNRRASRSDCSIGRTRSGIAAVSNLGPSSAGFQCKESQPWAACDGTRVSEYLLGHWFTAAEYTSQGGVNA